MKRGVGTSPKRMALAARRRRAWARASRQSCSRPLPPPPHLFALLAVSCLGPALRQLERRAGAPAHREVGFVLFDL